MKKILSVILALLCLIPLFTLTACEFNLEGTETWDNSADGKEDCVSMFNEFFAETFKNTNQVATVKLGGEMLFVETIDGAKDFISYSNGTKTYSFIDGSNYVYAMSGEENGDVYFVDKAYYDYGYFAYKGYILSDELPDEGVTYKCTDKGEGTFGKDDGKNTSTAELNFEITDNNGESVKIKASAKNGLVESVSYTYLEDGKENTLTVSIVYGSASVTVPDISGWSKHGTED